MINVVIVQFDEQIEGLCKVAFWNKPLHT